MLYIYVWNFFFQALSGFLNPFSANSYVFGVLFTSMSSLKSRLSCPKLLLLRTLLYLGICKKLELKQEVVQEPVSRWREHRQSRHDVLKAGIGLNLYWVIDSLGAAPWGDGLVLEPAFVSHGYKVCFGSHNIVNIHFSRKQQETAAPFFSVSAIDMFILSLDNGCILPGVLWSLASNGKV